MATRILIGDVRAMLATLPDESVHCVVTSPPYYGLRDYGTATWEGGDPGHEHDRVGARGGRGGSGAPGKQTAGAFPSTVPASVCSCGAKRMDAQIGNEPTLAEYIAGMVEVFREVRRVLRADGSVWCNIGDSYSTTSTYAAPRTSAGEFGRVSSPRQPKPSIPSGLKPKDLMMVPARLALALQQPFYAGRIKNEADRIWLAAMIDAEGCMFIHKRKAGDGNHSEYVKADGTTSRYSRTKDTFGSGLEVANTSLAIVERCQKITGQGSICSQSPDQNNRRKQTIYRWNMRSNECREVVREVYPFLVAKQQQARILIGCPNAGEAAAAAHQAMIGLHNGEQTAIDFPVPASMWEPGWYIRKDIIWAKKNCMPESCTDRPTSSHEHIFLLTKAATYFFDGEAVRENAVSDHASGNGYDRPERISVGGRGQKAPWNDIGGTRNVRDVWTINPAPFPEAHFATFPPELPERCIKAGTSEHGCCPSCGAPWRRTITKGAPDLDAQRAAGGDANGAYAGQSIKGHDQVGVQNASDVKRRILEGMRERSTTGWQPTCACDALPLVPAVVLDPFAGACTTLMVADQLGRDAVGIELSETYAAMGQRRIDGARGELRIEGEGLFATVPAPLPLPLFSQAAD